MTSGYKNLIVYKLAVAIYDLTQEFCQQNLPVSQHRRTREQMEQAARSGKQNIAEGALEKSVEGNLKLTGVARASYGELAEDYEDFLRVRQLPLWDKNDPRIVIIRRTPDYDSYKSYKTYKSYMAAPETAANMMITLCYKQLYLLDRLLKSQEEKFIHEGGFREKLFQKRSAYRSSSYKSYKTYKSYRGKKGFTLMEVLLVVSLISILAGIFFLTNLKTTFQKARDSKRKQDLTKLSRILEDYYNDWQRYPANDQTDGSIYQANWGEPFDPYLPLLPKDPQSPKQNYFYQSDLSQGNFYALYAKLEYGDDPDIVRTGCDEGCGPDLDSDGKRDYNYIIVSSNVLILAGLPNGIEPIFTGGDGGGDGGGGGGGGAGEPSPTAAASPTLGPSPTVVPTFGPAPTNVPGTCGHGDICIANWCGAPYSPPGTFCVVERCEYSGVEGVFICSSLL